MANDDDVYPFSPFLDEYDEYIQYLVEAEDSRNQEGRALRAHGSKHTHFVQDIGRYVTPPSNTWESYSEAVRMGGLGFNPAMYAFDKELALRSKNRAIYDPSSRNYTDYEPLRHNLAVIRNYVLNHFYGEELDSQEARDKQKLSHVVQIGGCLGDMLRRGTNPMLSNPFQPSVSPKDANVEYDGAALMYNRLLKAQRKNTLLAPVDYVVHLVKPKYYDRRWKLPPIELTPFGRLNMYAPPPANHFSTADAIAEQAALAQASLINQDMRAALELDAIGTGLVTNAVAYNSVDTLAHNIKIEAIEIARDILDKLKLQFNGTPVLAMLDYANSGFKNTISNINSVIAVYVDHLQRAAYLDPSLAEDPMVLKANDVVGFIGAQVKLRALERAEMLGDVEHADLIRHELEQMPAHWMNPNTYTSAEVLEAMDQGIQMVVATLAITQDSGMEQNQRGLMLQQFTREPDNEHKRMQSLAFDETYQRLAAERREAYTSNLGYQRSGGTLMDNSPDALSKKHGKGQQGAASSLGFDTLLSGAGADLNQMRGSVNAQTSGNFSAGAPGSIQQVIAHHAKAGTKAAQKDRHEKRRDTQKQATSQQHANRQHVAQQHKSRNERMDAQKDSDTIYKAQSSKRDRPFGR